MNHYRPKQVIVGGKLGGLVWLRYIVPLLKTHLSSRELGAYLGVSHTIVQNWRKEYGRK